MRGICLDLESESELEKKKKRKTIPTTTSICCLYKMDCLRILVTYLLGI